jgi:SAM-dependent methyltransferase
LEHSTEVAHAGVDVITPLDDIFEFETVAACTLCGSEEQHDSGGASWHGIGFSYCICCKCGLKYMRPRPTAESYQRFFKDAYWQRQLVGEGYATSPVYSDKKTDQMQIRMPKYRKVYKDLTEQIQGSGFSIDSSTRVLEVGCGFGYSLEWLHKDFGCQVFGIEPSTKGVERCRDGGVPIIASSVQDFAFGPRPSDAGEKYDIIIFRMVLDMIIDPVEVMREIRDFLNDDGIIIVTCNNVEYYDAMDPYHPYVFSPETLRRLTLMTGYGVIRHFHTDSPISKEIAISISRPNLFQTFIGRKEPPKVLETKSIDPVSIAQIHRHGKSVIHWHELGARGLLQQLSHRGRSQASAKARKLVSFIRNR